MRHLFIINPAAGKHLDVAGITREINNLMAAQSDPWAVMTTKGPGDAEELARMWAQREQEPLRIYALGGDGTLNEVVNGAAGYDHVAVGCCPMGSGNDFVKTFGKDDWRFRDLSAQLKATPRPLDLIDCNGRLSINVCSVGFDARVGLGMVEYKHLPLVTGKGAYLMSLAANFVRGIHRHYALELDGEQMEGEFTLICACNGRWYGGSFNPVPDAIPDDGLLDFVIVKAVSRLTVAGLVNKYGAGLGKNYPDIITMRRGKELKVRCSETSMVNIDGERLDTDLLSFALSAKKIHFLIPEGASWEVAET